MAVIDHRYTVVKSFVLDSMRIANIGYQSRTGKCGTYNYNYFVRIVSVELSHIVSEAQLRYNRHGKAQKRVLELWQSWLSWSFPKGNAWQNHACAAAFASHWPVVHNDPWVSAGRYHCRIMAERLNHSRFTQTRSTNSITCAEKLYFFFSSASVRLY